ncbi:MAG TPA: phosphatidylglycerol lysyltransferase domain-containing protein [Ktedonobacterales bacterium]|jgi:lysylphosphatidylglycerol synthetase-like protein (DUF2156 family)|nr:phosphatidylglycerol lysyltransferase domain-containing protein [Ktedonobacterales bacterium]
MLITSSPGRSALLVKTSRSVVALALMSIAIANLAMALIAHPPTAIIATIPDFNSLGWGRDGVVVTGALTLVMSLALARGKRHAWVIAVALMTCLLISSQAGPPRATHISHVVVIGLGMLVALVVLAPLFPTRSDPRALKRGYLAIAVTVAALTMLQIIHRVWDPEISPLPDELRSLALSALRVILFVFLTYGLIEALRPVLRVSRPRRTERVQAIERIRQYATRATDYFATADEMNYFWSKSGESFLSYRLLRGVALALGDPIGPAREHTALLRAFDAYARRQDWVAAVYLAGPACRQSASRIGMHAYKVGEEAVIETERFTTAGKAGAPVRHAMTRARKDGVTVRVWQGEQMPHEVFAGMLAVSQAWLNERGHTTQMGFSAGRFPADWSPDLLTIVAFDASGRVCAFQTWTPLFAGSGWALDVMRRAPSAPPGVTELLIAETIAGAKAQGSVRMSLGLAPLAGLDASAHEGAPCSASCDESPTPDRAALSRLERGVGFLHQRRLLLGDYSSLYHFKAKWRPIWEPRYLLVSDRAALPQALSALMYAQGYRWWRIIADPIKAFRGRVA